MPAFIGPVCVAVLMGCASANRYRVPEDVFIAIGLHETGMNPYARGDRGYSIGPWQIYTRVHRLPCRRVQCQAEYGARMLRRFIRRSRTLRGAIQMWNYRSRGYARKVLRKRYRARRLIRRCRRRAYGRRR